MIHTGYIESELTEDTYTAACSCEWSGPERLTEREAAADLTTHYEDMEL